MSAYSDPENEYNAVLSAGYAEKQQFCSLPGAVNRVGDTIKCIHSGCEKGENRTGCTGIGLASRASPCGTILGVGKQVQPATSLLEA